MYYVVDNIMQVPCMDYRMKEGGKGGGVWRCVCVCVCVCVQGLKNGY